MRAQVLLPQLPSPPFCYSRFCSTHTDLHFHRPALSARNDSKSHGEDEDLKTLISVRHWPCAPAYHLIQPYGQDLFSAVSSAFIIDTRSKLQLDPSDQSSSSLISPQDRSGTTLFITCLVHPFDSIRVQLSINIFRSGNAKGKTLGLRAKVHPKVPLRVDRTPKTSVDESLAGRLDATWIGEACRPSPSDLSVRSLVCPPPNHHSM